MSKRIGIAVLGAGRWGVHLVRNFWQHPEAQLVAVVDPHWERLAGIQERFDLQDVVLANDWQEVREMPEIEAVAIATPASTHYSLITDALNRGYHVLAEKPLTLDPEECLDLCHLAERQERQLMVDHTYLFHPAVEAGKEAIALGRLGELRYGYAARTHLGPLRQDVDALWDLAIHDISIFNLWLGEMPVQVQAKGTVWLQRPPIQASEERLFSQGLADLVWATLTYPSGFQAFIHLCWFNPDKQRRLSVMGTQGTLIFDEMSAGTPLILQRGYVQPEVGVDRAEKSASQIAPQEITAQEIGSQKITPPQKWQPGGQGCEILPVASAEPLQRVCDRFLDCAANNRRSSISSGWVGADLVKILTALSESMKRGNQPVLIS